MQRRYFGNYLYGYAPDRFCPDKEEIIIIK